MRNRDRDGQALFNFISHVFENELAATFASVFRDASPCAYIDVVDFNFGDDSRCAMKVVLDQGAIGIAHASMNIQARGKIFADQEHRLSQLVVTGLRVGRSLDVKILRRGRP